MPGLPQGPCRPRPGRPRLSPGQGEDLPPCHPEHHGENFSLIEWDVRKFSHAQTGFPLTGAHKKISDCAACHAAPNALKRDMGKTYLLRGRACADCHADAHGGRLGTDCARCHSADVPFKQAAFDHGKTRFPLSGAHKTVACASCHPVNSGRASPSPAAARATPIPTGPRAGRIAAPATARIPGRRRRSTMTGPATRCAGSTPPWPASSAIRAGSRPAGSPSPTAPLAIAAIPIRGSSARTAGRATWWTGSKRRRSTTATAASP